MPALSFQNYVGYPKQKKTLVTTKVKDIFVGNECSKYKGILKLNYPIEHGIVVDWENMELVWRKIYEELKCSFSEHPVLITEPPNNPFFNK